MLDIINSLSIPEPWGEENSQPLPSKFAEILASCSFTQLASFEISESTDDIYTRLNIQPYHLPASKKVVAVGSIAEIDSYIQENSEELKGRSQGTHIILKDDGDVFVWDKPLVLQNLTNVWVDFSHLSVVIPPDQDTPMLIVSRCSMLSIKGLALTSGHNTGMRISDSEDISIIGCILVNSYSSGICLAGGNKRITIQQCFFAFMGKHGIVIKGGNESIFTVNNKFGEKIKEESIFIFKASEAAGYADIFNENGKENSRDSLILSCPNNLYIFRNQFQGNEVASITAIGVVGLFIEQNTFDSKAQACISVSGISVGISISQNSFNMSRDLTGDIILLQDVAFFNVYRNLFTPGARNCLTVYDSFGGGVIAFNSMIYHLESPHDSDSNAIIAINIGSQNNNLHDVFGTTTVIGNTIRGLINVGISLNTQCGKLFLFDNSIHGATDWSVYSFEEQSSSTSLNNWSPTFSHKQPISERPVIVAPDIPFNPLPNVSVKQELKLDKEQKAYRVNA